LAQEFFYSKARSGRHQATRPTETDENVECCVGEAVVGMDRCSGIPNGGESWKWQRNEGGGGFLTADLNIKILCAKMVPNNLSEDEKLARRQVLKFWT